MIYPCGVPRWLLAKGKSIIRGRAVRRRVCCWRCTNALCASAASPFYSVVSSFRPCQGRVRWPPSPYVERKCNIRFHWWCTPTSRCLHYEDRTKDLHEDDHDNFEGGRREEVAVAHSEDSRCGEVEGINVPFHSVGRVHFCQPIRVGIHLRGREENNGLCKGMDTMQCAMMKIVTIRSNTFVWYSYRREKPIKRRFLYLPLALWYR